MRGGDSGPSGTAPISLGVRCLSAPPVAQEVLAGSPAAKAGVHAGDLLLKLDGDPIDSVDTLLSLLLKQRNGSHTLLVRRGATQLTLRLSLSSRPGQGQMGIRLRHGVLVAEAPAGSPGGKAGLQPGDIVYAVNDRTFNGLPALQNMLRAADPARAVRLGVNRDGRQLELIVPPDPAWLAAAAPAHPNSGHDSALGRPPDPALAQTDYRPPAALAPRLEQINTLRLALVDPATGRLVLVGHYDPAYPTGPLPYQDLFAAALANPYPEFSLEFPGLGDPALARIRATFDEEHARLSRNSNYGIEWLKSLILPVLTGGGSPEDRLALGARLRAAGTTLEAYEAYLRWQDSKFTDNRQFLGAQDFLCALFTAAGCDAAAGRSAAAHRLLASEPTHDHFDFWALQTGRHEFFRRNRQEVENGRNRDEANAEVMAELYTAMLHLMGASDSELRPLAAALRTGRSDEQPFLRVQERLVNDALRSFLAHKVVNGMTFSGASLSARYHLPPLRSALNTFGAPRDSALMRVFFDADYTLKHLGSSASVATAVPDHATTQQFLAAAAERAGPTAGRGPTSGVVRHWIQPATVQADRLPDHAGLHFRDTALRIASEPLDLAGGDARGAAFYRETVAEYGRFLSERIDGYARTYPALHALREAAKVVAFARWARTAGLRVEVRPAGTGRPPLPSYAEGFWGLTCLVQPSGETDALILWAQGGVTFTEQTGSDWLRLTPPAPETTDATLRQLAASVALAEKAALAAEGGHLELARDLAEKSAQAMCGQFDLSRLPEAVPVPVGPAPANPAAQAALVHEAAAAIDQETANLRNAQEQRAAAEPLESTDPTEFARLVAQAREAETRSAERLRQLREHLQRARGDLAPSATLAVQSPATGTVGLTNPPASSTNTVSPSYSLPPALAAQAPQPETLRAELARLRTELETLKTSLGRLNRSIQADQEQFAQWEAEAAGAIERAETRAKDFVKDQVQDAFFGWAEHYFTDVQPSPDRLRDLKAAKDLMDLQEFKEWAERKDEGLERVADGVRLLADKLPVSDRLKDLIGAVDSSIESAFDISAWLASWKRINQLEKNSDAFRVAVARSAERMRTIVTRIKELEAQLERSPPAL